MIYYEVLLELSIDDKSLPKTMTRKYSHEYSQSIQDVQIYYRDLLAKYPNLKTVEVQSMNEITKTVFDAMPDSEYI